MKKTWRKILEPAITDDPKYKKLLKEVIALCEEIKELKQRTAKLRRKIKPAKRSLKK